MIIREIEKLGFEQQLKQPTHIEGRQIDHVFLYSPHHETTPSPEVHQFGQYFTDHDLIQIDLSEVSYQTFSLLIYKLILFRVMTLAISVPALIIAR